MGEWAAHAVVGYLVEAVLNWLEFGDPDRDEQFAAATNHALRAGVHAWADAPRAPAGGRRPDRATRPPAATRAGRGP